jgi:hypothetical protein
LIWRERDDVFEAADADQNWMAYLHQIVIASGVLEEPSLTIVTFNYDRLFEHFLFEAVTHSFGLDLDGAAIFASPSSTRGCAGQGRRRIVLSASWGSRRSG